MSCYNDYLNLMIFPRYCLCLLIASEQQVKAVYPNVQVSVWSCIYVWHTSARWKLPNKCKMIHKFM